jgi:hypothetical protein
MPPQKQNHQKKSRSHFWVPPVLLLVGLLSYLITVRTIKQKPTDYQTVSDNSASKPKSFSYETPKRKNNPRPNQTLSDLEAEESGALSNLRSITFADEASMRRFMENLGDGVTIVSRIDALQTVLVRFDNIEDLEALLDGSEETSLIFPVNIPGFEGAGAQAGAEALGSNLLKWLGVEGCNSEWGKGLIIAVLDTGIADHTVFRNSIQRINLVPLPANEADLNGHGTAVASLIFSSDPFAPGVAPGATPLSVRVADDNGSSNSFLIAQGIIAAVDAGASIINISLGGSGNSAVVNKAIEYAYDKGAVIVASSGNSGTEGVMQPAANPFVIAVGAVDAQNQALDFSTTGSQVAISAPGYKINTAYTGNTAAQVNGTSFSAPIIVGTIAATTSNSGSPKMSPQQAASLVLGNLKDVGVHGTDPATGGGVPDMWGILNSGERGIHDASINSIYTTSDNQIQVIVQNLGTETLVNAGISINVNGSNTVANITTLAPNETRLITVPSGNNTDLNIHGSVRLSSGQSDQRPSNDTLSTQITISP